jgi:hypothetical protein
MRILALALLFAGCTSAVLAESPADQGYRKLTGPQIRKAFVGKNFTDETHFSDHFKADGTIDGYSIGRKISNTWKIVKDELCITNDLGELCYAVWKKGADVQLVFRDSDVPLYGLLK